jgi:hypothetical protein
MKQKAHLGQRRWRPCIDAYGGEKVRFGVGVNCFAED